MVATPTGAEGFRRGRHSVITLQYMDVNADQRNYFLLVRCQTSLFARLTCNCTPS